MSDKFEQAEIYIKDLLAVPIEMAIRNINKQLDKDRVVPGLILMVTGGQAIQEYFPNSKPLRTHDFDLKLIAPSNTPVTTTVLSRMKLLSKGIAKYIQIALNKYVKRLGINLKDEIKSRFGIELILDENNDMFTVPPKLDTSLLNIITFKLKLDRRVRTNSITDIFVADPNELLKHFNYWEFTGLSNSNPILSEGNKNKYYIPYKIINEIPYAGMGYIIWDTYRMVEDSKARNLPKQQRYVEKRDAIIQALNNPVSKLSCHTLKDYINSCEKKYNSCDIKGKKYKTVSSIIDYAISEGLLPTDSSFIRKLKDTHDIDYICEYVKKLI